MHGRNVGGTYNFGPVSKHSRILALDLYSGPLKSNNIYIYKKDPSKSHNKFRSLCSTGKKFCRE